jgi:hypothetical protein
MADESSTTSEGETIVGVQHLGILAPLGMVGGVGGGMSSGGGGGVATTDLLPPLSSIPQDVDMMDVSAVAATIPGSNNSNSSNGPSLLPSSDGVVGGGLSVPLHPSLAPLHRIQSFEDATTGATAKTPKAVVSDDEEEDDDDDDDDDDQSPRMNSTSVIMDSEDRQVVISSMMIDTIMAIDQ